MLTDSFFLNNKAKYSDIPISTSELKSHLFCKASSSHYNRYFLICAVLKWNLLFDIVIEKLAAVRNKNGCHVLLSGSKQ